MRNSLLGVIFSLLYWSRGISADDAIQRGTFRFMGFLYYQDESVHDGAGDRFLQGAVLIRQNFLISSTLISSISDDPLSKTLLARLGAIRIDVNFTLYEDEDEQEQEIVQITRPTSNRTNWWAADISLLKTLLPFKMTSAVHITQLSVRQDYSDKICKIIVFKKMSKILVGTRFLAHLSVEMLPSTAANCGEQFDEQTMACAVDPSQRASQEDRSPADFCQGNSGGPLICDNDVMALQTYIKGNCKPPHLYQLLAPWKKFLACGTENNCNDQEKCPNVCSAIFKDSPLPAKTGTTVQPATVSTTTMLNQPTLATTNTTTTKSEAVITPETTKQTEPFESTSTSREESAEATVSEPTESKIKATAAMTEIAVINKKPMSPPVNDSKSTPVQALIEADEHKEERDKKVIVKMTASSPRRYSSSSTDRYAISLQGLVFNSLVACICFM